ncbi:CLUMA_CG011082, isoform A [Clunio marinus]|uniref:CLUMA_CG011082, isoform A n=1 Tax=Clunio marinus TaxID=568069 RepID=A0A1J1IFC6_9DIPT|nr:CLUMA_CG011082, isoform A [Clunio marinus]
MMGKFSHNDTYGEEFKFRTLSQSGNFTTEYLSPHISCDGLQCTINFYMLQLMWDDFVLNVHVFKHFLLFFCTKKQHHDESIYIHDSTHMLMFEYPRNFKFRTLVSYQLDELISICVQPYLNVGFKLEAHVHVSRLLTEDMSCLCLTYLMIVQVITSIYVIKTSHKKNKLPQFEDKPVVTSEIIKVLHERNHGKV